MTEHTQLGANESASIALLHKKLDAYAQAMVQTLSLYDAHLSTLRAILEQLCPGIDYERLYQETHARIVAQTQAPSEAGTQEDPTVVVFGGDASSD